MMKRIYLDTNIMMDAIEGRKHGDEANTLLDLSRAGIIQMYAATMSFATMSYLLRHHGKEEIHQIFEHLMEAVEVVPVGTKQFEDAMAFGPVRDFEDMMQYQCAKAVGCDVIVTNNGSDFAEFCDLPIMSAKELLMRLC